MSFRLVTEMKKITRDTGGSLVVNSKSYRPIKICKKYSAANQHNFNR